MLPTFCNFAYDNNYLQLKKKFRKKSLQNTFGAEKLN